jgi:hypothetical protein
MTYQTIKALRSAADIIATALAGVCVVAFVWCVCTAWGM